MRFICFSSPSHRGVVTIGTVVWNANLAWRWRSCALTTLITGVMLIGVFWPAPGRPAGAEPPVAVPPGSGTVDDASGPVDDATGPLGDVSRVVEDGSVRVDRAGYGDGTVKVAVVVADAVDDRSVDGRRFEVRDVAGRTAYAGDGRPWSGGARHAAVGDHGWVFDFTALRAPGTYRVVDPLAATASGWFEIRGGVDQQRAMRSTS